MTNDHKKENVYYSLCTSLQQYIFPEQKTNLELRNTLEKIISSKKADVGILIIGTQDDIVLIKADNFYLNKKD
ncbi:hypothetical protein [Chryseobacterium sp. 3008163]|uniref:hypothetical protein n=1 Tax=Chryseobacterium sp. 3008163 TaxID=2478663 RepID=UPI000F0C069E|nr:hypothetical protein [Chryseobacterium sp. 3008163]AYN02444.1 hypothetical protein EAG08_20945 [Chryseobacterium sp. 3008163]